MISLTDIIALMFFHWLADFVLQTRDQADNKSKKFAVLIDHTAQYACVLFLPVVVLLAIHYYPDTYFIGKAIGRALLFCIITFLFHTATDFYTSKTNSQLYEQKNFYGFFCSVGFDQFLHYAQLFIIFKLFL